MFRKSKNLVGLDIGSSAIKLVELKDAKGGGYRLVKSGLETLSPEAIVDGAIMDASLVVDTVNRLVSTANVRNSDFGTSLSGHSVIVKKITMNRLSSEDAQQAVPFASRPIDLNGKRVALLDITKAEGKPEQAWPKIVDGRLNAWFKDQVLLDLEPGPLSVAARTRTPVRNRAWAT